MSGSFKFYLITTFMKALTFLITVSIYTCLRELLLMLHNAC